MPDIAGIVNKSLAVILLLLHVLSDYPWNLGISADKERSLEFRNVF